MNNQIRALEGTQDPFDAVVGSSRGEKPAPKQAKPNGKVKHPAVTKQLVEQTMKEWEDISRWFFDWTGVRSSYAECLWVNPTYQKNVVHLRSHNSSSTLVCATGDYDDDRAYMNNLNRAKRGSWQEPNKANGEGSHGSWKRCTSCERHLKDELKHWKDAIELDANEDVPYPVVPQPMSKDFKKLVRSCISLEFHSLHDNPSESQQTDACNRGYRLALAMAGADIAYSSWDDAFKRLIGWGYQQMWHSMPKSKSGWAAKVALPMKFIDFLPKQDYENILLKTMPETPQTLFGGKEVQAETRKRVVNKVNRMKALHMLAITEDDD